MKVAITGSSGYLGSLISNELIKSGHSIIPVSREHLYHNSDELMNIILDSDAVIHLSGSPILTRWNKKNKNRILSSRTITTHYIVNAIGNLPPENRPKKLIQASAIGIYKPFLTHDESSFNFNNGFVGNVVQQWEKASEKLPEGVERTVFRIGLVIGKNAKTIKNLKVPFYLGFGAKIGNGNQPFPFIHEADVASAFRWAIDNENVSGTFNLVAPQQISNKDFTNALAKEMSRPAIFTIPEFVLKMILGESAMLLTDIPGIIPKNLEAKHFNFQFPRIETALEEILSR